MSTELTVATEQQQRPSVYGDNLMTTIEACQKAGQSLAIAYNLGSPHHGTVMMLACASEGLSVANYTKRYHGDGTMRATAIQAEFMSRGGKIEWTELGDDGKLASAKFSHPTLMPKPNLIKYTIEDARRQVGAKMDKDGSNWKTNPGAMLRAALIRKAVKIIDPGVVGGYDNFNDLDSDIQVVSAADTKKDIEARRAELLEQAKAEPATSAVQEEPIIDAVVEEKPKADPKPDPEPVNEEVATEAVETPATTEVAAATSEEDAGPASHEQLSKLLTLGQQFPSEVNKGKKMDKAEIASGICKACAVEKPQLITSGQANELIARWEEKLSGS